MADVNRPAPNRVALSQKWRSIAFAFVALGSVLPVNAQMFYAAPEYATAHQPQSVASGDFNNDGKPDLVTADTLANTLSILLNKGDGTFQTHADYATGSKPEAVVVGDFNGDLKLDLAVTNYDGTSVSVLLGNGDGTFRAHVDYQTGAKPTSMTLGDFNGDGVLDLVVGNTGEATISVLLGNGDGTFQSGVKYSVTTNAQGVVVGDFNADHVSDIAVAFVHIGQITAVCGISVLLGNGNGTFQAHIDSATNCGGGIAVGDFNRDGRQDLAIANNSFISSGVGVLLGNGNGTFKAEIDYDTDIFPSGVEVVDLNRDGNQDLALAGVGNAVGVLLGNGDGTFGMHQDFGAGDGPVSEIAADFNGDGRTDVATANAFGDSVSLLFGVGDGTFFPVRRDYLAASIAQGIAVSDLNHDGIQDLAVADGTTAGFVSILLSHPDGTFATDVVYPVGSNPDSVAIADFNGDSHPDLATANSGDSVISILLNKGDGTFQPHVDYPVSSTAAAGIIAADLNQDGRLDIAVALGEGAAVLLGNGDGSFQPEVDYGIGGVATSVVAADFNGDGKLDLALPAYNAVISVLLGNGDGTFQPGKQQSLPAQPFGAAVGDVNGDGIPDLVVAGGCGCISVLIGNGDGTFQPHKDYAGVSILTTSVALADFTGDGNLDVVVTNSYSSTASVFVGKGDGTFPTRVEYTSGGYAPAGVAVGDFNRDRKPDIAFGGVSVLINASPVPWFALSLSTNGNGSGTVKFSPGGLCGRSCSKNFASGTTVVLTAIPDFGSSLSGWSGGGCAGTGACSLTLTSDQAVAATFSPVPEFSVVGSSPSPNPINAGQSSTSTVNIKAVNGFNAAVSLTCSVAPTPALAPQCSIGPSSVGPGTSATLTINTTPPVTALLFSSRRFSIFDALLLPVIGFAMVRIRSHQGKRTPVVMFLICFLVMGALFSQSACGGNTPSPGTPAGHYTITVNGSSGSLQHSTKLALTVN
jgi:VCBS repeat protein/List-Bact-rpt repeat protein/FG-GAP repeat protein